MRAYFNQQALIYGDEFSLPGDAGYLNVSYDAIKKFRFQKQSCHISNKPHFWFMIVSLYLLVCHVATDCLL